MDLNSSHLSLCLSTSICVSTYVPTYVCMHLPMNASTYECIYLRMHLPMYVTTYVCIYLCMYLPMYVSTFVYTYLCVWISSVFLTLKVITNPTNRHSSCSSTLIFTLSLNSFSIREFFLLEY